MPSSESVTGALAALAHEWRWVAIAWHGLLALLAIAIGAGWRPAARTFVVMAVLPLVSVSVLAWRSGNPFNGGVFAALALGLSLQALLESDRRVTVGPPAMLIPGALLVGFGAVYPEFAGAASWSSLVSAPLGVLPCPTLALIAGSAIMVHGPRWPMSGLVAAAASAYGILGAFWLRVEIDVVLLVGALVLLTSLVIRAPVWHDGSRTGPSPHPHAAGGARP